MNDTVLCRLKPNELANVVTMHEPDQIDDVVKDVNVRANIYRTLINFRLIPQYDH